MSTGPEDHFSGSHYQAHRSTGPVGFLRPTKRYLPIPSRPKKQGATSGATTGTGQQTTDGGSAADGQQQQQQQQQQQGQEGVYHVWRSRDNRKGRHSAVVSPEYAEKIGEHGPKATNTLKQSLSGMYKMVTWYPVWDISYDVATVFTIGSVVWVINGFFVWLPLQDPSSEFPNETDWGGGLTAFLGATIFVFGSVLLMLEAVNENRNDCFGWALEEAWDSEMLALKPSHSHCEHHHRNKRAWLHRDRSRTAIFDDGQEAGPAERHGVGLLEASNGSKSNGNGNTADGKDTSDNTTHSNTTNGSTANGNTTNGNNTKDNSTKDNNSNNKDKVKQKRTWSWWPTGYELRTHYFRDIGFLACLAQMIGASIFWIAGLTGIPAIFNALSIPASNGIFWLPQVVGGSGFIVSSILFMIECQQTWYKPAPKMLGWHIGLWNLVGALGFTLCGALGFAIDAPGVEVASTLSTFIGSWAFLIGSVIQWYESLDKYPVTIEALRGGLA